MMTDWKHELQQPPMIAMIVMFSLLTIIALSYTWSRIMCNCPECDCSGCECVLKD